MFVFLFIYEIDIPQQLLVLIIMYSYHSQKFNNMSFLKLDAFDCL
jgi:hypothetical protein